MTTTEETTTSAASNGRAPSMSRAPKPQDRKPKKRAVAKPAVQREAEADNDPDVAEHIDTIEVPYDGEIYNIPADPQDWPIMATRAFEKGHMVSAIEELVGAVQFNRMARKGYRNRHFAEIYDAFAEVGGFKTSGN